MDQSDSMSSPRGDNNPSSNSPDETTASSLATPFSESANSSSSAAADQSSEPNNDSGARTTAATDSSSSSPAPLATIPSNPFESPQSLRSIPPTLKIIVHFRAIGDAPILKKTKFQLSASNKFSVIIEFLRKHLHSKPTDSLFLYCNSAFSPSPDVFIYDLYQCFQLNKELIVNYAIQDAWG